MTVNRDAGMMAATHFTPLFIILAGLAAFGTAVVLLFVNPKWYRVE